MKMKYYKFSPLSYVPRLGTQNQHHLTFAPIKAVIDKKGRISLTELDSLSMKYGHGANKGKVDYGRYLIRMGYLVECAALSVVS